MSTKRRFLFAATGIIGAVIGSIALLMDSLQTRAFELEMHNRIDLMAGFADAYGTNCTNNAGTVPAAPGHVSTRESAVVTGELRRVDPSATGNAPVWRNKVAALHPRNGKNQADEYEANLLARFRADRTKTEIRGEREIAGLKHFFVARPVAVEATCLDCHGDPASAPPAVAQGYGSKKGFGWKCGDIVAVTTVAFPSGPIAAQQATVRLTSLIVFGTLAVGLIGAACVLFQRTHHGAVKFRMLSRALQMSPVAVMVTDPKGTIEYVNPKFVELTGYTAEDVTGQSPRVLHARAATRQEHEQAWQAIATGRHWRGELQNERKNGELYWEHLSISTVTDTRGDVTNLVAVAMDITERKRAENEARRFRAALDCSADAVFLIDRATMRFIDMNETACTSLGYERGEMLTMGPHDVMPMLTEEALAQRYDELIRDEQSLAVIESEHRRKDGSTFLVEVFLRALNTNESIASESILIASVRDVTERRQAHSAAESLNQQLVNAARRAGMAEVATSVLHNVGNVLNGVTVSAGLIREKMHRSPLPDLRHAADIIESNQENLADFITNDRSGKHLPKFIVELSKQMRNDERTILEEITSLIKNVEHIRTIISTQQSYAGLSGTVEAVSLARLVDHAIQINSASLAGQSIDVARRFDDIPPVLVDRQRVLQILVNLISNAKRACVDGDKEHKEVTISLEMTDSNRLQISVSDNGIGIHPENLTRVFAHGFTTRKDGHGFGLHSAALAAEELDGKLTVTSDGLDAGSTFTLELPNVPAGASR